MTLKLTTSLFIIFVLATWVYSQSDPTSSLDDDFQAQLALGPCKSDERLEAVKSLFLKMGAAETDITVQKFKDVQNVVIVKKGKTDQTVIVGAHYDKVRDGCGIIDNWSGIVVLARLYETLRNVQTQKSYIFVAFDKEESGLQGSSAMAKAIPKEKRENYCSMINLDSFGMGYPVILENLSSSKMTKLAKELGDELKANVTVTSIGGASADSVSFKTRDIPAITITGLSGKWSDYLHTSKDTLKNTLAASVRIGYYFGLEYINRVESGQCNMFR